MLVGSKRISQSLIQLFSKLEIPLQIKTEKIIWTRDCRVNLPNQTHLIPYPIKDHDLIYEYLSLVSLEMLNFVEQNQALMIGQGFSHGYRKRALQIAKKNRIPFIKARTCIEGGNCRILIAADGKPKAIIGYNSLILSMISLSRQKYFQNPSKEEMEKRRMPHLDSLRIAKNYSLFTLAKKPLFEQGTGKFECSTEYLAAVFELTKKTSCAREALTHSDRLRPCQIDPNEKHHSQMVKGDEAAETREAKLRSAEQVSLHEPARTDRFGKVAAGQNVSNLPVSSTASELEAINSDDDVTKYLEALFELTKHSRCKRTTNTFDCSKYLKAIIELTRKPPTEFEVRKYACFAKYLENTFEQTKSKISEEMEIPVDRIAFVYQENFHIDMELFAGTGDLVFLHDEEQMVELLRKLDKAEPSLFLQKAIESSEKRLIESNVILKKNLQILEAIGCKPVLVPGVFQGGSQSGETINFMNGIFLDGSEPHFITNGPGDNPIAPFLKDAFLTKISEACPSLRVSFVTANLPELLAESFGGLNCLTSFEN